MKRPRSILTCGLLLQVTDLVLGNRNNNNVSYNNRSKGSHSLNINLDAEKSPTFNRKSHTRAMQDKNAGDVGTAFNTLGAFSGDSLGGSTPQLPNVFSESPPDTAPTTSTTSVVTSPSITPPGSEGDGRSIPVPDKKADDKNQEEEEDPSIAMKAAVGIPSAFAPVFAPNKAPEEPVALEEIDERNIFGDMSKSKRANSLKNLGTNERIGSKINSRLRSKKKSKKDGLFSSKKKSGSKSKSKSKKSGKWPGGFFSFDVPFLGGGGDGDGDRSGAGGADDKDGRRRVVCPVNTTLLFIGEEHDVLCHNAALGINITVQIEDKFFHELAPSTVPTSSHAPSTSMAPSSSPSISFEPTITSAPSKTPKDLRCRPRPTETRRRAQKKNNPRSQPVAIDDELIIDAIEDFETTTDITPPKDARAIAGGWNPDGPNDRPKHWYELPFCDEVPTSSPAPSSTFSPTSEPSVSFMPSTTSQPSPVPSSVPTDSPTLSSAPTLTAIPSAAPSRPGFKGELIGQACALFEQGITEMGVGKDVEVGFVYELVTTDVNITSDSDVISYMEEQMNNVVVPSLFGCDAVALGGLRRLQTSASGIEYLVPQPNDELFEPEDGVNQDCGAIGAGDGEICVRVSARVTAIVAEDLAFVTNDIQNEILRNVRDGLDSGIYINDEESVVQTKFIGLLQEDGNIAMPSSIETQIIESNDDEKVTAMGASLITAAVVGAVLVVLLVTRKRTYTNTDIMEELEDEEELYKEVAPKFRDDVTDITATSAPKSEFSADLNAFPGSRKNSSLLQGNEKLSTIVDELRSSEAQFGYGTSIHSNDALQGGKGGIGKAKPTQDVHVCTSATCEICQPWKQNDPTFIPTAKSKQSPKAKRPKSNYKFNGKRAYKTEDTVVL